jgi:hypothetical protein
VLIWLKPVSVIELDTPPGAAGAYARAGAANRSSAMTQTGGKDEGRSAAAGRLA